MRRRGLEQRPTTAITGIAPKAYLGNYKIYGSPGLNDGTTDDVIIQASKMPSRTAWIS